MFAAIAWVSIAVALGCAFWIAADEMRHPQAMAIMNMVFFRLFAHPHLTPFEPQYWLMMQIAMICGYATSFPMNRWLIRAGWKEAM